MYMLPHPLLHSSFPCLYYDAKSLFPIVLLQVLSDPDHQLKYWWPDRWL